MHIQCLAIALAATDRRRHDYQLVLGDKVAYTALFRCGFVAGMCLDVELERGNERKQESDEQLECQHGGHIGGGNVVCAEEKLLHEVKTVLLKRPDAETWKSRIGPLSKSDEGL